MIEMYFGLPRSGKTTILTATAYKLLKRGIKVYGNVPLQIPGYVYVDNDVFGKYDITDAWVLIDEATIYADSRDFKSLPKSTIEWLMLHGHDKLRICFFAQQWDGVDKKIRNLTERVWYVYKRGLTGLFISKAVRVPYTIAFPVTEDVKGHKVPGDITMGYFKPNFIQRVFARRFFRPRWYRYFDSWIQIKRPPLPSKYKPYSKTDTKSADVKLSALSDITQCKIESTDVKVSTLSNTPLSEKLL